MIGGAGSGLTGVSSLDGDVSVFPRPGGVGAALSVEWILPDGSWWRVRLVAFELVTTATVEFSQAIIDFTYGASPLYRMSLANLIEPGWPTSFSTFGVGLPFRAETSPQLQVAPLPEVLLPPGSIVTLSFAVPGGTVELVKPVMVAVSSKTTKRV